MINLVVIQTKYGQIKGCWVNNGLNFNFEGALFKDDVRVMAVEFSFPYGFIKKHGEQIILDEIKESVESYVDTYGPENIEK